MLAYNCDRCDYRLCRNVSSPLHRVSEAHRAYHFFTQRCSALFLTSKAAMIDAEFKPKEVAMQFDELVQGMSEAVYQRLLQAVETGKWPDGTPLSEEQRSQSHQLVMAWQALHLADPQHLNIGPDGEIVQLSKQQLKNQFSAIPTKTVTD